MELKIIGVQHYGSAFFQGEKGDFNGDYEKVYRITYFTLFYESDGCRYKCTRRG